MYLKNLKHLRLLKLRSPTIFFGKYKSMSSTTSEYQEVIKKLNALQTAPHKILQVQNLRKYRIESTLEMCSKLGFNINDLDRLNIIHITGSKGKGSTCALVESILRSNGYKTGLFTSPHLIEVRERIKLNGCSLDYTKFTKYFNYCYKLLIEQSTYDDEFKKPIYFQFLTCMMFYTFLNENIDVAIIEVGIGGAYDSTNIIQRPVCSAITSLALEHTNLLGNTLEEIAWQKSGIFKQDSLAFCADQLTESSLDVVQRRAEEKKIPLCIVKTGDYSYLNLKLHGSIQHINCSLAIQIANYWISKVSKHMSFHEWLSRTKYTQVASNTYALDPLFDLNESFLNGLTQCTWPGRNQIIEHSNNPLVKYYIDGAHTVESIEQFIQWFMIIKQHENENQSNVLLFNYTGDRNAELFLKILMRLKFKAVAFSKLQAYDHEVNNQDHFKKLNEPDDAFKYDSLVKLYQKLEKKAEIDKKAHVRTFTNVNDSIEWLTNLNTIDINSNKIQTNVIVTGSLYLVGILLQILNYKIK